MSDLALPLPYMFGYPAIQLTVSIMLTQAVPASICALAILHSLLTDD